MSNKKNIVNEDIVIRNILNTIRGNQVKTNLLTESKNDNDSENDVIAITNDPKFGQEVLKNQIEEFKSAVDGGDVYWR